MQQASENLHFPPGSKTSFVHAGRRDERRREIAPIDTVGNKPLVMNDVSAVAGDAPFNFLSNQALLLGPVSLRWRGDRNGGVNLHLEAFVGAICDAPTPILIGEFIE